MIEVATNTIIHGDALEILRGMPDGMATYPGGHTSIHKDGREPGVSGNPVMATKITGYRSGCAHDDDTGRSVVLDPFMGSGTVALVAKQLNRQYIGIELNADYVKMAEKRLAQEVLDLTPPNARG